MSRKLPRVLCLFIVSLTLSGCMSPWEWWSRVNGKAKDLQNLRSRHSVISQEFESLKLKYLELEHKYASLRDEVEMERNKKQNWEASGSEEGRHLANITYTSPTKLPIEERYNLALQHLDHGKFPESFVLFESFLWIPEGGPYQTSSTFYHAGVSAYEIKNYNRAREYFEAAVANGDGIRDNEILRRTRLWLKVLNRNTEGTNRKVASEE